MKPIIIALLSFLTIPLGAQDLMNTTTFIKSEAAFLRLNQLLQNECMPLSMLNKQPDEWFDEKIRSIYLNDKQRQNVKAMYRAIGNVRGNEIGIFCQSLSPLPTINSNKDTCVFVGGFSYQTAFNQLRLTENQRARRTVEDVIIPVIQSAAPYLKELEYPYSIIGATYDVRNFSNSNPYAKNTGCVICIFKTSDIMSFYELEITQEELLKSSKIYVEDADDIKRISFN